MERPCAPRERIVAVAYAMTAGGVKPQGITAGMIAAGAVSAAQLLDGSVSNADIAANAAIDAGKIADGAGSGLDADLLDGVNSTSFSQTNHNHDAAYVNEGQTNGVTTQMITDGTLLFVDIGQNGATNGQVMMWNNGASRWEPATPAAGGAGGDTNLAWRLAGNTNVASGTHFLGTLNSNAVEIRVDNRIVMRYEPNLYPNIIGGDASNFIHKSAYGAVIAGGGHDFYPNIISQDGNHAAILGGWGNVIGVNAQGSGIGAGYRETRSESTRTTASSVAVGRTVLREGAMSIRSAAARTTASTVHPTHMEPQSEVGIRTVRAHPEHHRRRRWKFHR